MLGTYMGKFFTFPQRTIDFKLGTVQYSIVKNDLSLPALYSHLQSILNLTHHSTNHDHIRSQYFTDGKNIKHPDDPQHDVEAVERMTNSKSSWIQAKTGCNEEQSYGTSITQIPFGRGPFSQFLV